MNQDARVTVTLFHASKRDGLAQLDPAASHSQNLFGPAIYATKDRGTAECQHGPIKSIYQIKATGPFKAIIELNQAFGFQDEFAQKAIEAVCRRYRLTTLPVRVEPVLFWIDGATRELIDRGVTFPAATLINRALADEGIWLLRGVADPITATLPQDRGIQWAILKADHASIMAEEPRYLPLPEMA